MIEAYTTHQKLDLGQYYDELIGPNGQVRPHWEKIAASFYTMGQPQLKQKASEVAQLLRENGVTYNTYGDPDGMNRPWNLDPIPMVFSAEEWEFIERGIKQRATLLNLILKDLYGPKKLIAEGFLPLELIYNHGGFLRQVDKIDEEKDLLINYAVDLARGPDGKLWVLHDRTDTPSGIGYALENRAAMTRVFPAMVRDNKVQKIAPYFQVFKNTLSTLSTGNIESPRIVLFSSGPAYRTYFEHAYLSSFLGFTLALGADLTMSNGNIWLKTLDGLKKVDVLLRRVNDIYCDPLEFDASSTIGIVGLMEAIRQEKVAVANPLGTRILENPGLMAYLPQICRHLLGEELLISSVSTWWCGQDDARQHVFDNMHQLIIKNVYRDERNAPYVGAELSEEEALKLKKEISQNPSLYVAQTMVDFSTTPTLIHGNMEARNAVLRGFAVKDTEKDEYVVMPGGLARSSAKKGVFVLSRQSGGISKDVWVVGSKIAEKINIKTKQDVQQQEVLLPSRTGEHLFWMGRYLERSLSTIRLFRIILKKFNESDNEQSVEKDDTLSTLLTTLTTLTGTLPGFTESKTLLNPEKELLDVASNPKRVGSLSQSLELFLSNGYSVRDRLSLDTWRILDKISFLDRKLKKEDANLANIYHRLDDLIVHLMAFNGLNLDNMTREPSWRLLNIGRAIETSIRTSLMLQNTLTRKSDEEKEKAIMELVLMANESLVTYRYQYRSTLELSAVLRLLLTEEKNPKSVAYQIASIEEHLANMPNHPRHSSLSPAGKKLLQALTDIRLVEIDHLIATQKNEVIRKNLNVFFENIIQLLEAAADHIYEDYFSPTQNQFAFLKTAKLPEI